MMASRRSLIAAAGAALLGPSRASAEDAAPSAFGTASETVAALAGKRLSSRELVDAQIARIEALDQKINAVVVRDFDRARTAAGEADAALARGDRHPLLGLPMTVKEQFNVAGLPTTWGYARFRDWRPDEDALAVQRLKAAGAIIIGKTNVPTGLGDWQSTNPVYGTTNNPWDVKRTPGGSSGGAAAALAAGFVALELGSDIGGSLRAPAHFCGVFAHKPSLELIPQRGSGYPDTPAIPTRGDLSVVGPMARSAADLALALDVLAGPDELWDGIGYRVVLPPPRHGTLKDFRVLVIDAHPLCETASSVRGALDGLADRLAGLGCAVARTHPDIPNLARTTRVYVDLLAAALSADQSPDERARTQAEASALPPENLSLPAAWLRGSTMTHAAWIASSNIRAGLRAHWEALFKDIDVILCPPMPTPAFVRDRSPWETRKLDVDGKSIPYGNQVAWSAVATVNGFPATVAPIGRSDDGLPIGVQIIGGYLEDRTTIGFAALIEREWGGFARPPGF